MSDPHLREHPLAGRVVHQGSFLEVREDEVRLPDGGTASREYVVHPGAVAIVPLLDDGRLVLERQFRYPVGQVLLEFPAGKIDPGEYTYPSGLIDTVKLFKLYDAGATMVFAQLETHHQPLFECVRSLELELSTRFQANIYLEQQAARGAITDVKTLIGLMWLQKWRAGLWPLSWQG